MMMTASTGLFLSALVVGFIGSGTHCVGMCSGIMGALAVNIRQGGRRVWPFLVTYNIGRVMSYGMAGAVLGAFGHTLMAAVPGYTVTSVGDRVAAVFMVALGLFLGGWWRALGRLEVWGGRAFAYLRPIGQRFLPVKTLPQALGLGLVWGFLPCGLVYSVLAWALVSGSALRGGVMMLIFGMATWPGLLAVGRAARFGAFLRLPRVRKVLAALIVGYGLVSLMIPMAGMPMG